MFRRTVIFHVIELVGVAGSLGSQCCEITPQRAEQSVRTGLTIVAICALHAGPFNAVSSDLFGAADPEITQSAVLAQQL